MTLPAMTPGSAQASTLADVTPEIVQTNGSRRREIVRDFAHNRLGLVGLLIVVVTLLAAVIGPLLWHTSYSDQDATRLLTEDQALIPLFHFLNFWATRNGIAYEPRADGMTLAQNMRTVKR